MLSKAFGSDRKNWPRVADDSRVEKFVLHQLYDPSKHILHRKRLKSKSGFFIANRANLAQFCEDSGDNDTLARFDLACISCIQNLDRLRLQPKQQPSPPVSRLEFDVVGSFHFDQSSSPSFSQNDQPDAKKKRKRRTPKKAKRRGGPVVEYLHFDAAKPKGEFQIVLRIPGGEIVRTRKTLMEEECIPQSVKSQIAALPKRTTSTWTQLIGDKSKHPMYGQKHMEKPGERSLVPRSEEEKEYDSIPSERVRCLPNALFDVLGFKRKLERKFYREQIQGSLDVCDIRFFSNVVKRDLNINLMHLKPKDVTSDPASHKSPHETWLTFFSRQTTGKYLLIDSGHAQGIDCARKLVWVASRVCRGLEMLTVVDERRAFARKIVENARGD